ncbi:MAG TPA: chorismate mutase [Methanoregulaceae archaeon]|nr:chorismate mutase [Methanoregulaceae archaeon]HPD75044.1 chorismate mutase [Methanoregulaceae archaeon]HRY75667.1 chorismate mutase [Methanoregulaceae archaeon]
MRIEDVRKEIDQVDREIIRQIARRQEMAGRIARLKFHQGLPIHDDERTRAVLDETFRRAVEAKIDPVSVKKIFEILIQMSEERQRECQGEGNLP